MEVIVVLVDQVRRVSRILREFLNHVSGEKLAVRFFDAPVELAHQLARLGAVEEVYLRTIWGHTRKARTYTSAWMAVSPTIESVCYIEIGGCRAVVFDT